MILVMGATGNFGRAIIEFLLQKGVSEKEIIAFARDDKRAAGLRRLGIQVKIGNYDIYNSLVKAFDGVDKLMFVSGSEVEKRDAQHENVLNAAMDASVKHIVYTSFHRQTDDVKSPIYNIAKTHINTDNNIINSGIGYTLLRNALYADLVPVFVGESVIEAGIYLPAGDGRAPFTARLDLAEVAANILMGDGHLNKIYRTVNTENYSFHDIARMLSEISGTSVSYTSPSIEEYTRMLLDAGVPKEAIPGLTGFVNGIREGYFESETSDLERLLGRQPKDLKTFLQETYMGLELS